MRRCTATGKSKAFRIKTKRSRRRVTRCSRTARGGGARGYRRHASLADERLGYELRRGERVRSGQRSLPATRARRSDDGHHRTRGTGNERPHQADRGPSSAGGGPRGARPAKRFPSRTGLNAGEYFAVHADHRAHRASANPRGSSGRGVIGRRDRSWTFRSTSFRADSAEQMLSSDQRALGNEYVAVPLPRAAGVIAATSRCPWADRRRPSNGNGGSRSIHRKPGAPLKHQRPSASARFNVPGPFRRAKPKTRTIRSISRST